jgi:hypothetical protein
MRARGYDRRLLLLIAALALPAVAIAQSQPAPPVAVKRPGEPAPLQKAADGRYAIQVLVATLNAHAEPTPGSAVIAELQEGARLEADERRGNWYRIRLADGRIGWVNYVVGKISPNFSVDARPGLALGRPGGAAAAGSAADEPPSPPATEMLPDDHVVLQRPMGKPLEEVIPIIDPKQVPPPAPLLPRETVPVPDRWRLTDELALVNQRWFDPYNPNTLKGDRPVFGKDWFFELSVISDTLLEWRQLPTPIGAQSTERSQSNDQFGRGRQSEFQESLIVGLSLIKGDTTFKPPDFQVRLTPVINFNRTVLQEVRGVNIDPTHGITRNDNFVALQEAFFDVRLRDVSERFDFDSIRVGIQPFTSDFRSLLYLDQPVGVRLFGTRDNNQWQYNLAWFRLIERDTNSGLNDISKPLRNDNIYLFNLYKQDFYVPGFTLQGTLIYNDNHETATEFLDNNGFQVRPAVFGDARPHTYKVGYVGLNGDGHFGRWNTTASLYYAFGRDSHNQLSQQSADISAFYGVAEVSRDFDWYRIRGTALFASGDSNPFDGKETGFDAIRENPQIAGASTSYWIRQAVPLIGGGGVALSARNGVLASLRSSEDQGQSNFINPGVALVGIGADLDVTPQLRLIGNLNELWFANTSVLSVLRNQGTIDRSIGTDISAALEYRPLFSQNIVLNASAAVLLPGKGLKQLYDLDNNKTQYSILVSLLLAF